MRPQAGPGLADTLQLAASLCQAGSDARRIKAVWFYARAWDFAPAGLQGPDRGHSSITGTSAITARSTARRPSSSRSTPSRLRPRQRSSRPPPSPSRLLRRLQERASSLYQRRPHTTEPRGQGVHPGQRTDEDATGLWALLKGQPTPVPGNVISDPATVLKITVTTAASPKPKEYVVKLTNSVACSAVPVAPGELKIKDAQDYILANGVKADTDAMGDVLTATPAHLHKIAVEPSVTAINVAVTQDAKDNHVADFIVNLKEPLSCKEAPASRFGARAAARCGVGWHLRHLHQGSRRRARQVRTAQIVLREGFVQQEKKAAPGAPRAGQAGCRAPPGHVSQPRSRSPASGSMTNRLLGIRKGSPHQQAALFSVPAMPSSKGLLHAMATRPA